MLRLLSRLTASLVLALPVALLSRSQEPPAPATQPPTAALPKLDYPDSTSGLEHLIKDIVKAQKENDGARAELLLKSLVLPDPRSWYDTVFGGDVAEQPETLYEKSASSVPAELARFFLDAEAQGMKEVHAVRFDRSCDDNAGEDTFGILHARLQPVPLYELRLMNGNRFVRLFALAFVDGAFRFIYLPKMEGQIFGRPGASNSPSGAAQSTAPKAAAAPRFRVGGAVQAAKLIHRVQPKYPEIARREHLQGNVRLHTLIDKDGSLKRLYVIKGYCSLAEASLEAVRQWRYSPTTVNGEPVEVDTEIDVFFQLSR